MVADTLSYQQLLDKAVKLRKMKEGHRQPVGRLPHVQSQPYRFRAQASNYTPIRSNYLPAVNQNRRDRTTNSLTCYNCGKTGHLARYCFGNSMGQSRTGSNPPRNVNPRTTTIEPVTNTSQGADETPHVPSVIDPESIIAAQYQARIIPLSSQPHKGITHKIVDGSGNESGTLIGLPKGVQPTVQLNIGGLTVECLVDSGSQINLMEQECLNRVLAASPKAQELHPPAYPSCKRHHHRIPGGNLTPSLTKL